MKKILSDITYGLCLLALIVTGCNKDFLERKPVMEVAGDDVWTDPNLIQAYVNDMYYQMRHGYNEVMLAAMTDEARFIHDYNTSRVVQGNMSADDYGRIGSDLVNWGTIYTTISNCNRFFEEIDKAPFGDESWRKRLKGETHFMRAWYYHLLVKFHGGVPLITRTYKPSDGSIMMVPRNSFAQCISFITAELDSAINQLPEDYDRNNKGRASKFAALGLKSRVLLYAASDLFNNSSDTLTGYTGGDRVARWKAAKDAALALIQTGKFELYKPTASPVENYSRVFLDKDNKEIIFNKLFNKELLGTSHDLYNGPNGYHNWGGNVPLENFVSGYQMEDGKPFDWSNSDMAKQPYAGRDPRFYATILYDGAKWKARPADAAKTDPLGIIQTGRYEVWNASANRVDTVWGLDTRNSAIENWNGTYSGYYLRKFMDINLDAQFFRGDQPWVFLRYAEILLNYAEACIGLGEEGEARNYVNMVRTRAGMPATGASGQALVDIYRYERRYELAFEEHRYIDARRWKIADKVFNTAALAIEIYGKLNPDHQTRVYTYNVITTQPRKFDAGKDYLLPIPANEIRKNPGLLRQNPGY